MSTTNEPQDKGMRNEEIVCLLARTLHLMYFEEIW